MRWILIGLLILNIVVFAWFARLPYSSPESGSAAREVTSDNSSDAGAGAASLRLLSERGRQMSSVPQPVSPATDSTPVTPGDSTERGPEEVAGNAPETVAGACYDIGPFADRADLDRFLAAYRDIFTMEPFTRQRQIRTDHRVYLPPYGSREEAQRALEELRGRLAAERLAIDTLLLTRGEFENGIALGVFSEARNAGNVQAQLSRLGYDVRIVEEPRTQEEFWVSLSEVPPATGSGAQSGARVTAEWPAITRQRPLLQRTEKLC